MTPHGKSDLGEERKNTRKYMCKYKKNSFSLFFFNSSKVNELKTKIITLYCGVTTYADINYMTTIAQRIREDVHGSFWCK